MKKLISFVICASLVGSPAFAEHKPKAVDLPASVDKVEKKIVDETVDAVVDELVGEDGKPVSGTGMPPGLAKKGKLPPGLEKQGKVPPGWSKAKIAEEPKKEGVIRRFVKKLFGQGEKEETKEAKKEE